MTVENSGVIEPEFTAEDAQRAFADGYDDKLRSLGRFNLAIVGDTGVGKSSLVNAIFGDTRAQTGIGAPVTKEADYYVNDDATLGVWDFEGFEHGKKDSTVKVLRARLKANQKENSDRKIHVAWFCWDASGARVTEGHKLLIEVLRDADIPVIAVLTKAHVNENGVRKTHLEFAEWIEDQHYDFSDSQVRITAAVADEDMGFQAHGLQELLDATVELAPATVKDALKQAQVIDLRAKRNLALSVIGTSVTAAGAAAATPIPVASAVVLAPIQLAMFGGIAAVYGTTLQSQLGGAGALQLGLQLTGKAAAESLVKFIPGAGSVINTAVATVWTGAAGEAWRRLSERTYKGEDTFGGLEEFMKSFGPLVEQLVKSAMSAGKSPTEV